MQLQLLQIAVHGNHRMQLPYIRAFGELEASKGISKYSTHMPPFIVPNSILRLSVGMNEKDYLNVKEMIRRGLMGTVGTCFIDIVAAKSVNRSFVLNAYNNFLTKYQSTGNIQNKVSTARALKAYSLYLLHQYCDRVLMHFYSISIYVHIFKVADSLRALLKLFPENELLFDYVSSYGLELAPFTLDLSQSETKFKPEDNSCNLSNTVLRIPSTEGIAGMVKMALKQCKSRSVISYDLDENEPESLIKKHLKANIRKRNSKEYLRKDNTSYLYSYDTNAFETLTALTLIRNVITLELSIEIAHVPLKLWLQLLKNVKINFLLWRNSNKNNMLLLNNKESIEDQLRVINKRKVEEERNLASVEYMLRIISNRIKILDYSLFKTYGYKLNQVSEYLYVYYKVILYIKE